MMVSCQYRQLFFCAAAGQSSCDQNSGGSFSYGAPESGWPSSDSSWQRYYMFGTTTKLSMEFQVLKEILFLGLGLTVTSEKKYRNKT